MHSSSAEPKRYGPIDALRRTVDLVWSETDSYAKRQLALSFVLLICVSTLGALIPVAYKLVIDGLAEGAPKPAYTTPILLVCAYVACQYIARLAGELRGLLHGQGVQRLDRRLSDRLFDHIIRLPLRYHLERKTGAIGETLGQGLGGCQTLLQHLVFTFLPVIIEFTAIALVLVHFQHSSYLIILGAASIAYTVAFTHATKNVVKPAEAVSDAHIDANATLTDSLLNYETVKYFSGEAAISGCFDDTMARQETAVRKLLRIRALNGVVVGTIFMVSLGVSLWLAGKEVLRGTMTVGDFVLINTYVVRLVQPLEVIGYAIRDISEALAYLSRMLDLFAEKAESERMAGGASPSDVNGSLTFEQVSLAYQPGREVLKDINFSVAAGQTLAIVGVSGSGKSSLVRLLFRLYEPDSGRILLDGTPVSALPLSDLRGAIAVVPQDTVLFNDTLGKNIAFGKRGATREEIEQAARLAHLHELIAGLPEGYDTMVGERGLKLSGGEKQRVAIARAALKRPRIFVFDEATSSLDTRTEREILRNLIDVAKDSTTIIIAHRLSTVLHADEIIVLHQGFIVERGTHAKLLQLNGSYAALWRAQQSGRGAEEASAQHAVA